MINLLKRNRSINKISEVTDNFKLPFFTCLPVRVLTFIFLLFVINFPAFAYEDCIVTANAKLTGIQIKNNDIIDVFPLTTVMNEKNTLIVHPLKPGKTKFSVLKNGKDKVIFEVEVTRTKTEVSQPEGFDVLTIDCPVSGFERLEVDLDEPPVIYDSDSGTFELDNPPIIKERKEASY